MDGESAVLHVQNPVRAGHQRLPVPAQGGVLPLGHLCAEHLGAGQDLPRHVHAVNPRRGGPDLADDRPLSDGLELHVLAELHLAAALHLQAHAAAPGEELGDAAVLPRLGGRSPGHREDVEIAPGEVLRDVPLQNAVVDALKVEIPQELLQGDPLPVVLRGQQAGVGQQPVPGQEEPGRRLHGQQLPLQGLCVPLPAGGLDGPEEVLYGLPVLRVPLHGLLTAPVQLREPLPVGNGMEGLPLRLGGVFGDKTIKD